MGRRHRAFGQEKGMSKNGETFRGLSLPIPFTCKVPKSFSVTMRRLNNAVMVKERRCDILWPLNVTIVLKQGDALG